MVSLIICVLVAVFSLFDGCEDGEPLLTNRFESDGSSAEWELNRHCQAKDGLLMVARESPAMATYLHPTALGERSTVARFVPQSDDLVFGLLFDDFERMGFGTLAEVNLRNGTMRLASWDGTLIDGRDKEGQLRVALTRKLVMGDSYYLKLEKKFGLNRLILMDRNFLPMAVLECEQGDSDCFTGRQWGRFGVFCSKGEVCVEEFNVSIPSKRPAYLIVGDSNVEGPKILGKDYSGSWAYLLKKYVGDSSISIAGRGGDESANVLNRLAVEIALVKPKSVVFAIGTNDTNHGVWRNNMAKAIAFAVQNGAVPILCTLLPRTGHEHKTMLCNSDIRSKYFGDYLFIDLSIPVSKDGRGIDWDEKFDSGDHVHASLEGMQAIFDYLCKHHAEMFGTIDR